MDIRTVKRRATKKIMRWRTLQFKDFVTLQRGFDLPKSDMKGGSAPVIGSNSIIGFHDKAKVDAPGVITGRSGTLGLVQYSDKNFWPHNTALWVKDFKGNNPQFVYYKLQTLRLERFNGGVSVPTLNRNILDTLSIKVPGPSEQRCIVSILSAYDDLIENNRRRIQLLERTARLLYKEWFVHLRFPGHEHIKITNGILDGWERKHLSELVTTQYGFTETASSEPIGPKFLRGTDINKTSYINWSTVPYCPEENLDFNKYALKIGDIVVVRMADPGKTAIVETEEKAVFASYLVRLTLKPEVDIPTLYLFYVLDDGAYRDFISSASGGTTRKSASAKLLIDFNILIPSSALMTSFFEKASPLRQQIQKLIRTNSKLSQARDLLLPRLMNGDLTI